MTSEIPRIDVTTANYESFNDNEPDRTYSECGGRFSPFKGLWLKIAGVVLLVVIAAVITYFVLSHNTTPNIPSSLKEKAQFDKLVTGQYSSRSFNGTWLSASEFYYSDNQGNLLIYNCDNNSETIIINRTEMIIDPASYDFSFSQDRQYLLYATGYRSVFRHSNLARYYILHLTTKKNTPLTLDPLRLVVWAPTGVGIAYVSAKNDIWYRPYPEYENDTQVTNSGGTGYIFNGVPDWVYEEEVLESNIAMWFSADAKKLAFVTFNDSQVPIVTLPTYGRPGLPEWQYVLQYSFHYPKVGRPNPTVEIQVADLSNVNSGTADITIYNYLPPDSVQSEPIIVTVTWATNTDFLLTWMNRYQNISSFCMCSTVSQTCEEKFVYSQPRGWILPHYLNPVFDLNGERMVTVFLNDEGGNDFYPQVVLFDFRKQNVKPVALTRGKIAVSEISFWDTYNEIVYFISTVEGKPEQTQTQFVSSIVINDTPSGNYTCLSCDSYKTIQGKPCLYAGSMFSSDGSYYVISCLGPDVPEVTIYNQTRNSIMLWERNNRLRQVMEKTDIPNYSILDVPLENNYTARVYLNHPNIDPSLEQKYPLLIRVYSGPESALVTEQFKMDFDKYYASNRNVYLATIDGRGSGLRGSRNSFAVYKKLGTVEIEDQMTVIKYLIKEYKNIDPSKVGVWGWSYGGYATGMMLTTDTTNVIKCGIAVAPVTDWLLYDTMYTERYMGAPTESDNYVNYVNSSLNRRALALRDKMFFLIHGTKDDNVHFQNSMFLAKILERNDILFRQMIYPDEDHTMRTVNPHLYHSIQQFLDECFDKKQNLNM